MNNKDNEKYSVLKQACIEWSLEQYKNLEIPKDDDFEFSKRFKRKINRINREIIGDENTIYPGVDNAFERTRSKFVRWLKKSNR